MDMGERQTVPQGRPRGKYSNKFASLEDLATWDRISARRQLGEKY
jgi:hypothetical protein